MLKKKKKKKKEEAKRIYIKWWSSEGGSKLNLSTVTGWRKAEIYIPQEHGFYSRLSSIEFAMSSGKHTIWKIKSPTTPPPLPPFRRLKNPANSVVCLLCPLEECKTIIFKYHNGQHMLFLRNDTTIWIKFSWSFQTMLRLLFFFPLQENELPRKQQQSQMGNFCFSFSTAGIFEKCGKFFICT